MDFKAVALFVTFESEFTRKEMEDEFKGLLARKGTLFRNNYRLSVHRAPDPVRHDAFACVTKLIRMCDVTDSCVVGLVHMCDMTHSYV